uniref:Uncharacterized protein n=1 Tax=Strigamia maritima TaxID=126957 RepID=T1IVR0_STRMM
MSVNQTSDYPYQLTESTRDAPDIWIRLKIKIFSIRLFAKFGPVYIRCSGFSDEIIRYSTGIRNLNKFKIRHPESVSHDVKEILLHQDGTGSILMPRLFPRTFGEIAGVYWLAISPNNRKNSKNRVNN